MTTMDYTTLYDRRVKLVQDTLAEHAKLTDKTAQSLAMHVLHALDHIPEKVR